MGHGYKHGGSGGANPLNFTVKTYPSETELKADKPKENTIGVITTTTMTSWVFSATEPTEPEVGVVWIKVDTSSPVEFDALKSKTLLVYPISAKQYNLDEFTGVTAMSYQSGEWKQWIRFLLCDDEYEGNWKGYAYKPSGSNVSPVAPTVSIDEGVLTMTLTGQSKNGVCTNDKSIDFSLYKTMTFDVNAPDADHGLFVIDAVTNNYNKLADFRPGEYNKWVTVNADLSAINKTGYIGLWAYTMSSTTAQYRNIKIE